MVVYVSVIGMIQKPNKHIVTYHGRLSFCYMNNTETKPTQKVTYHGRLSFCYMNDTETKQTHSCLPWSSNFLL